MSTHIIIPPLELEPLSGESRGVIRIEGRVEPYVAGRSAQCDVVISDPEGVISRRHCEFRSRADGWTVTDLRSKHGTWLNQMQLAHEQPTPLRGGDRIKIGLASFRVRIGSAPAGVRVATTDDHIVAGSQLQRFGTSVEMPDSHRRLDILMNCSASVGKATDLKAIAATALDALVSGCGFPRGSFLRRSAGSEVELLAQHEDRRANPVSAGFSRSLINACAHGETAVMNTADAPSFGQSIVSLGIVQAICTPVMIDGTAEGYFYLEARAQERSGLVSAEVVGFTQSVAKICAMAIANLERNRLEQDRRRRQSELEAARDVQAIIMPPESGEYSGVRYAMRLIPGRFVAGDLFDFVRIDEHRVGIFLGDVVGKGVAAGMIMSNVQAHLSCMLRQHADPSVALNEVNRIVFGYSQRYSLEHQGLALFLSLFVAVIDSRDMNVMYSDAGHGYWCVRRADGEVQVNHDAGGPPLGVVQEHHYENQIMPIAFGDRLIVYSDGVVEQRSPFGEEFGNGRVHDAIKLSCTVDDDVRGIIDSVTRHADAVLGTGDSPFADDVSAASVGLISA